MTDEEIVQEIADTLKPWKPQYRQIETGERAGEIEGISEAELKTTISETVSSEIARFRSVTADFFSRKAIHKTRDDARDIIKTITQLEEQLSAKNLSPELRIRLGLNASLVGGKTTEIANLPVPRLLDALKEVRELCRAADSNQPQSDQVKLWCAKIALRLAVKFSEGLPSAGSENTKYCRIAGLLYQSVTGDEHALRRICQDVLRPYQSLLPR